jgi:hypothetical protein
MSRNDRYTDNRTLNAFARGGRVALLVLLAAVCSGGLGCASAGERAKLTTENIELREQNQRLQRELRGSEASLARVNEQLKVLRQLGPDRPVDVFAPVKIEIASLSGGVDEDKIPGIDGVKLYIQPRDVDGDVVKTPGRIRVQLLDNSALGKPRVLGVYQFNDLEDLRNMWHGKFLTQHFSVYCPFPSGTTLPPTGEVTATVEFLDLLTGVTHTETKLLPLLPRRASTRP